MSWAKHRPWKYRGFSSVILPPYGHGSTTTSNPSGIISCASSSLKTGDAQTALTSSSNSPLWSYVSCDAKIYIYILKNGNGEYNVQRQSSMLHFINHISVHLNALLNIHKTLMVFGYLTTANNIISYSCESLGVGS